jgi:hypothetical protein
MPTNTQSYPMDDSHRQFLMELCGSCNRTQEVINKSLAAGMPYQQYDETNKAQKSIVTGLLQNFWGVNPEDL